MRLPWTIPGHMRQQISWQMALNTMKRGLKADAGRHSACNIKIHVSGTAEGKLEEGLDFVLTSMLNWLHFWLFSIIEESPMKPQTFQVNAGDKGGEDNRILTLSLCLPQNRPARWRTGPREHPAARRFWTSGCLFGPGCCSFLQPWLRASCSCDRNYCSKLARSRSEGRRQGKKLM